MKFMPFLAGLILPILIAGCSLNQLKDTGKAVAGSTYLYYEYGDLVASIKLLPLNEDETAVLKLVDSEIDAIRIDIGARYKAGGAEATIGLLKAKDYMGRLSSAFVRGEQVIVDHFKRRNLELPEEYKFYATQAYMTYTIINGVIAKADSNIKLDVIGFYLKAGLQALATAKLGPVGGAAAGALLNPKSL